MKAGERAKTTSGVEKKRCGLSAATPMTGVLF